MIRPVSANRRLTAALAGACLAVIVPAAALCGCEHPAYDRGRDSSAVREVPAHRDVPTDRAALADGNVFADDNRFTDQDVSANRVVSGADGNTAGRPDPDAAEAGAPRDEPDAVVNTESSGEETASRTIRTLEMDAELFPGIGPVRLTVDVLTDDYGNPVEWIVAADGEAKARLKPEEPGLFGVNVELKTEDLDGDGFPEVMLFRESTGSAGAKGLTVFRPLEGWKAVFSLDNPFADADGLGGKGDTEPRYAVKYEDELTISFRDGKTGLRAKYRLAPDHYKDMETAGLDKRIGTWIDPVIDYAVRDDDGDGGKEIVAVQPIIGVSHPDYIGYLKTTYRMREGMYHAVTQAVYDDRDRFVGQTDIRE